MIITHPPTLHNVFHLVDIRGMVYDDRLTDLEDGVLYYFRVTAVDTNGIESG